MKRIIASFLALLTLASLLACGQPAAVPEVADGAAVSDGQTAAPAVQLPPAKPYTAPAIPELEPEIQALMAKTVPELGEELFKDAFIETALAYYRKDPYSQYESDHSSVYVKGYDGKLTDYANALLPTGGGNSTASRGRHMYAPEQIWKDQKEYSQCSMYAYCCYYDAFETAEGRHYQCYGPFYPKYGNWKSTDQFRSDCIAAAWTEPGASSWKDYAAGDEAAHAEMIDFLTTKAEAGDILYTAAHILFCIGDRDQDGINEYLHCWPVNGGSQTPVTLYKDKDFTTVRYEAKERHEDQGAYEMLTVEDGKFVAKYSMGATDKGKSRVDMNKQDYLILYRPHAATEEEQNLKTFEQYGVGGMPTMKDYHLTKHGATRLVYRGLDVSKYLQKDGKELLSYDTVTAGETVTVCVDVANTSDKEYTIPQVTEFLPEGTELMSDTTMWQNVTVPAGGKVELRYDVRIPAGTPGGTLITFPCGAVSGLDTRMIELRTTGAYLDEAKLAAVAKEIPASLAALTGSNFQDLKFVETFYKEVLGLEVDIPDTMEEYLAQGFKKISVTGTVGNLKGANVTMYHELPENPWTPLQVPHTLGGFYVYLSTEDAKDGQAPTQYDQFRRVQEVGYPEYYRPGDVFACIDSDEPLTISPAIRPTVTSDHVTLYIVLGGGRVLKYDHSGISLEKFADTIGLGLSKSIYVTLRPSNLLK